jgi:predicted Zn finger-like uncharacterized protein
MILSCNSCEKKFVVPDNAIGEAGRLVQCSSCGNKWKQYQDKSEEKIKKQTFEVKLAPKKLVGSTKFKKRKVKKRGPNLYSPEYLAKKHGINIDNKPISKKGEFIKENEISFGFYNFIFISIIVIISVLKVLHLSQNQIIEFLPKSEIYLNLLFESIKNIKEIIQNFIINY